MMRIIGEIPARLGSKRVKQKNLRKINARPLITYAIDAAKNSKLLSEVYVNTESDIIGKIALEYGVKYYKRKKELSSDFATSDEFNYDFIKGTNADVLVMINPVSPLIEGQDIDGIIKYFLDNDFDTVITVREERLHAYCDNKPINFSPKTMLPRTQDISPIQICVWSICVWRAKPFLENFEKKGFAVFSGKVGFYPMSELKSVKISYEDDFILAEAILKYREGKNNG